MPYLFTVSKKLAKKAAKLISKANKRSWKEANDGEICYYRRLDGRPGRIPNIFARPDIAQIQINLANDFLKMLSGFAAVMQMNGRKETVIIASDGRYSQELREIIKELIALPEEAGADDVYIGLCKEFVAWLKSLGGVMSGYSWGFAELEKDDSVKFVAFDLSQDSCYSPRPSKATLVDWDDPKIDEKKDKKD